MEMSGNAITLVEECVRILNPSFGKDSSVQALCLISEILSIPIWKLKIRPDEISVAPKDRDAILEKMKQRAARCPLQYIIGKSYFMGFEYEVGPGVLIPRPDTEHLVQEAYKACIHQFLPDACFLEFCTGSGCVGITLAAMLKATHYPITGILTDYSDAALVYASKNLNRICPDNKVILLKHDLIKDSLDPITAVSGRIIMIIANPPYVKSEEISLLQPEVCHYEPKDALDGGKDGLLYYRRILMHAKKLLYPGGVLIMEISYDAKVEVHTLMKESGLFQEILVKNDYSGHPRVIFGKRMFRSEKGRNN
jgi:release factor glutamine methyltransferase